jgi:hypothetical protein
MSNELAGSFQKLLPSIPIILFSSYIFGHYKAAAANLPMLISYLFVYIYVGGGRRRENAICFGPL